MTPITRTRFRSRYPTTSFAPGLLFLGGEQGAWYDPSDLSTLFQDAGGTTPVTAVEQPVRLMLDKSGRGNSATAPSDAARPVLRSRYNRFTYSEEFDNAAWTKTNFLAFGSGSVANATTAPDGTMTADLLVPNTTNAVHRVRQDSTAVNSTAAISLYVKAAGYSVLWMSMDGASNERWFNLSNGTTGGSSGTATIEALPSGWFRCTYTRAVAASNANFLYVSNSTSTTTFAGDGTSGMYFWGAQILTANDSTNLQNRYQRIAAATSYDTIGFLPYLAFDGSDDSMSTSAIDFTGTNKMSVFAGVTKLSDAAQAALAELSATIASNNGSFLLSAPNSAAANYNFSSKGTTQVDNTVTTYAAPITSVVTGIADIGAPSNIIRINGAQAGSQVGSQGTGNYGNHSLFIGSRNNASARLNGRLYGLIVRGAQSSAAQITSTERWMAGKTGVTI